MERYLDPHGLANRLGVKLPTVTSWRQKKIGPDYIKAGRLIRYPVDAVERWEQQQTVHSTETVIPNK